VLASIFPEVYSIERIKALHERSRANLRPLRLANAALAHGDGYGGLEQAAPFHSIIIAAAAPRVAGSARAASSRPMAEWYCRWREPRAGSGCSCEAPRPRIPGKRARSGALRADGSG